jgi:hypothetical protein
MWIALLIVHGLVGFLLLGAITHQVVSVWAPVRGPAGNFFARYRAVGSAHYANAVVVLYLLQMILGGILYTDYRISVRLMLMTEHFLKSAGAFELKEHLAALGLGLLPAYWYCWHAAQKGESTHARTALTTFLAFITWWSFLVGHIVDNVRGLGT